MSTLALISLNQPPLRQVNLHSQGMYFEPTIAKVFRVTRLGSKLILAEWSNSKDATFALKSLNQPP